MSKMVLKFATEQNIGFGHIVWRQPPVAASCPQFFNSFRSARCMYPAILITNFYLDIHWTPFLLTGIIFLHHISSG